MAPPRSQIKLVKNRGRHTSTLLAKHVGALHSRFNLRRVIIESDKKKARDTRDIESIHKFLCEDSRIGQVPFWSCLLVEQQQELCKHLKHVVIPFDNSKNNKEDAVGKEVITTVAVDPEVPSAALYIFLCGESVIVEGNATSSSNDDNTMSSQARWKKLESGDTMGGIFVPRHMHEALALEKQKKLRNEWIMAKRGPAPPKMIINDEGEEVENVQATMAWVRKGDELEYESRQIDFKTKLLGNMNDDININNKDEDDNDDGYTSFKMHGEEESEFRTMESIDDTQTNLLDRFTSTKKTSISASRQTSGASNDNAFLSTSPENSETANNFGLGFGFESFKCDSSSPLSTIAGSHGGSSQVSDTMQSMPNVKSFLMSEGNESASDDDNDDDGSGANNKKTNAVNLTIELPETEQERKSRLFNAYKAKRAAALAEQQLDLLKKATQTAHEVSLESFKQGRSGICSGVALAPGSEYLILDAEKALPIIEEVCERAGRNAILKAAGLRCLLKHAIPHGARAGEILSIQGERSEFVGILAQGECRLVHYEKDGSSRQLAVLNATSTFGDEFCLLGHTNSASIICSSDLKYLKIPNKFMKRELDKRPELLQFMKANVKERRSWIDHSTKHEHRRLCWGEGGHHNEHSIALELDGLGTQSAFRGWGELPVADSQLVPPPQNPVTDQSDNELKNSSDTHATAAVVHGSQFESENEDIDSIGSQSMNDHSISSTEAREDRRQKLVKLMLVRTFEGLDPTAQAMFKPEPWQQRDRQGKVGMLSSTIPKDALATQAVASMDVADASTQKSPMVTFAVDQIRGTGASTKQQRRQQVEAVQARRSSLSRATSSDANGGGRAGIGTEELIEAITFELHANNGGSGSSSSWLHEPSRKLHPLEPFPTLTRNRGLHASKLPLVKKSQGIELLSFSSSKFMNSNNGQNKKGQNQRFRELDVSNSSSSSSKGGGEAWRKDKVYDAMPADIKSRLKYKDMVEIEKAVDGGLNSLRRSAHF